MICSQKEGKNEVAGRRSVLFANSSLTYIQMGELQKNIAELVHQNKIKYAKITDSKADFSYQLYKIGEFQANSRAFGKELLLRQLDRLLEEKNYLDRQLSLIRFEDQEETIEKEKMVCDEANHFELLKSIWKRDECRDFQGGLQHIEELNLMVGQIRNNIQSLIKFESNDKKQFEETYLTTFKILHEKNKECGKCGELIARNDYLKEKLELLEEKMSKMADENIVYLEEINSREEKIKKLSKQQLRQETELKDKIIRLEQEILKKDQIIRQLKKETSDLTETRFKNEEEGFEVIIKKAPFDLTKFEKKIRISCEELIETITQEMSRGVKIIQKNGKRLNGKSQEQSTEGSTYSYPEYSAHEGEHVIKIVMPAEGERRQSETYDRRINLQKAERCLKSQENELGSKKYMRTASSKRANKSVIVQGEENVQGVSLGRARGASPLFGVSSE